MTVHIIDIESIPTRYSSQWKQWIPDAFSEFTDVNVIEGSITSSTTDDGAFFNWADTNIYKSEQGIALAKLFKNNEVKAGDKFLFTDAWHPSVFTLRQLIATSNIKGLKMFGMFHAGSYDEHDILGKFNNYFKSMEQGLVECLDTAFFATNFSKNIFIEKLDQSVHNKLVVTGFPYDLNHLYTVTKKKQILFPHRISPEKNLHLFKELEQLMPEYKFIVTMDVCKTKDEYHKLLAESMFTVSFSEQETWGISVFESLYSDCIPIVPNDLSYYEMYENTIKYNGLLIAENVKQRINHIEAQSPSYKMKLLKENKAKVKQFITMNNIINHVVYDNIKNKLADTVDFEQVQIPSNEWRN